MDRVAWEERAREDAAFRATVDSLLRSADADVGDDAYIILHPLSSSLEVLLLGIDAPPEAREAIRALALRRRPPGVEPGRGWTLPMHPPGVPFRERAEYCRPTVRNRSFIGSEATWISGELRKRGDRPPPSRVDLVVFVDADGRSRYVELRETTGQAWLDEQLVELGSRLDWRPGKHNGVTVGVWAVQPITF